MLFFKLQTLLFTLYLQIKKTSSIKERKIVIQMMMIIMKMKLHNHCSGIWDHAKGNKCKSPRNTRKQEH